MNNLRKAAEMALKALLTCDVDYDYDENPYNTFDAEDVSEAIDALRQALAQPNITGDSATRSADSAESFCKQELHNLMSVAGRMALELECLLMDTKDLSVVSKWWDTGMESLQAYRDYIWSITHGRDEIVALAQPEQEPIYIYGEYAGEGKVVSVKAGLPKGAFEEACRMAKEAKLKEKNNG